MAVINAEKAFELMYELFKAKPWLNSAGVMTELDHQAEDEAVAFLLTLESAKDWGSCSASAMRVANSLLLDFLAKLDGPLSQRAWMIQDGIPKWKQAALVIASEIQRSHPHFSSKH